MSRLQSTTTPSATKIIGSPVKVRQQWTPTVVLSLSFCTTTMITYRPPLFVSQHLCPMGCQKCIFFSSPPTVMVPWYTVEPPQNGVCPKHCTCAKYIVDEYVQETLECLYENHVTDITEQFPARQTPTSKSMRMSASSTYWHNKADQLCINPDLLDLSAPLPPCVALLVHGHIDNMLDDFANLEEWFFGFENAPPHEKEDILEGYRNGTYPAILKKRRYDRAIALALIDPLSKVDDANTLFGPPTKKLRQTTLTQAFNEFPDADEDSKPKAAVAVIDLTLKRPTADYASQSESVIDLTKNAAAALLPQAVLDRPQPVIKVSTSHATTSVDVSFPSNIPTPPPHPKIGCIY